MIVKQLELGPMGNFTYLLGDEASKTCAVIDPGWEVENIIGNAKKADLNITHILLTHTHFDHANGAASLSKKTGAAIYVHASEAGAINSSKLSTFKDDDKISIGKIEILCLHTPGHTPGSACFIADGVIFTGDTLFADGIGRTDLEGSDPDAMFKSLARLSSLPDGVVVYPGHNYGADIVTTIGEQKKRNPYMRIKNAGDFLRM